MRATPYRITLTENHSAPVLGVAAAELGQTRPQVAALLSEASRRLRKLQRLKNEPIVIDDDRVKVTELAGLIRVDAGLELEVRPKFLGSEHSGWREDFFRIASLVQGGRILPHEEISAGHGESNDLASLVGRVMVGLFKNEQRRPIRRYRHRRWEDFELDGDLDDESLFLPGENGFIQEKIVLERRNRYNEIIAEAARLLVLEVEDQDVRRQLQRMYSHLSPQQRPLTVVGAPHQVPNRHRRWQQLYEIARRVVEGFGMNFEAKEVPAPGFIMRTWPAWENLLFLAMRAGLHDDGVEAQRGYFFGKRNSKDFGVKPDGTVHRESDEFLWDAKYKTDSERGLLSISSTDVYEANAFLEATGANRITLLYPRLASEPQVACGEIELFETVELTSGLVYGATVEARGISARGGFHSFSTNLAAGVTSLVVPVSTAA